jgi:cell division protein FtsB
MKIFAIVALGILLVFVGIQIFSFIKQEHSLGQTLSDIQGKLNDAKSQEMSLSNEVQYLANPANLEKELRARFNYKKPGETMMIIVTSSTASTSSDSD